jgi:hypothetical protein
MFMAVLLDILPGATRGASFQLAVLQWQVENLPHGPLLKKV